AGTRALLIQAGLPACFWCYAAAAYCFGTNTNLTKDNAYSISRASRTVVSTLSEPLTINVFFTRNLPAPYNNTERYLRDLLKEYGNHANRFFNYRFYDVSPEEGAVGEGAKENQVLARNYGISPVQIQAIEKDEVKFRKAYMGLVLIHGDLMERIPTITSAEGLEYTLTMAMQKLNNKISALLRLEGKINVRLYLSSSLESVAPYMRLGNLPQLPQKIGDIVKKLSDRHYGKLAFEYLDPSKGEALNGLAKKYNLMTLRWPSLSDGKVQAGEGAIGLVLEHGQKSVTIPLIRVLRIPLIGTQYEMADINSLEETISENLESLIDINEDLGYLADHGTPDLASPRSADPRRQQGQQTLQNFRTLLSQNYAIRNVFLKGEPIPTGLDCLVIAGPTEAFSDYELLQLDQFLLRGKSLALFLDRFQETVTRDQMPGAGQGQPIVPLETGLERLLDHYGIHMKQSYVMDESCYRQRMPAQFGGGETPIYFAPVIKSETINNKIGFMKNIKGLIVFRVSPLEVDAKRAEQMDLKVSRLFSSSKRSWEMADRINLNPMLIQPPGTEVTRKSLDLAYVLEGKFTSYFAGKAIPEKPEVEKSPEMKGPDKEAEARTAVDLSKIEGKGEFVARGGPGKIFVITSSELLKDNMLDEGGQTPNAMFILNVIDSLNDREDVALMRGKEQRFNPLIETGA
ncbi:MAG: Gldg family protein, partial [Desulfobacterales bacterium]|nr:Gldg family protein [Desulfobacterales bacterium]